MSLSQQQKKVQRSKDNKASQIEAMKNKKLEYYIPPPEVVPPKPKEVKKVSTKGNKFTKKDADKEMVDDLFSAYRKQIPVKDEVKSPTNDTNDVSNKETL
jgi:hypothetical protein